MAKIMSRIIIQLREEPNLFKALFSRFSNLVITEKYGRNKKGKRDRRGKKRNKEINRPHPVLG
jgi:hypothetical protein